MPGGSAPHLYDVAEKGPSLQPDTILQDALPATLGSKYPVPIVCEDGEYCGTLSKQDLVEILANSNAEPSDTGNKSAT